MLPRQYQSSAEGDEAERKFLLCVEFSGGVWRVAAAIAWVVSRGSVARVLRFIANRRACWSMYVVRKRGCSLFRLCWIQYMLSRHSTIVDETYGKPKSRIFNLLYEYTFLCKHETILYA